MWDIIHFNNYVYDLFREWKGDVNPSMSLGNDMYNSLLYVGMLIFQGTNDGCQELCLWMNYMLNALHNSYNYRSSESKINIVSLYRLSLIHI